MSSGDNSLIHLALITVFGEFPHTPIFSTERPNIGDKAARIPLSSILFCHGLAKGGGYSSGPGTFFGYPRVSVPLWNDFSSFEK